MDMEPKIKRLLVLCVLSLIVIFAAKWMLTKTVNNLGKAAAEKKQQAAASRPAPPPPAAAVEAPSPEPAAESAPASAAEETAVAR
jgi:hypothetical protein